MENTIDNLTNELTLNVDDVNFLKQSLIYQMSLGSKELFHSNVWAWLIDNDHEFLRVFFPDFDENIYEISGVSRELKHRDLIIWLHKRGFHEKEEKYFYVIENKIKSLQSKEQLEEYSENLWDNKILDGVITGIHNALETNSLALPIKNETNRNLIWTFVSYNEISKKIMNVAVNSSKPVIKNHLSQIIEYCQIVDAINSVIGQAINSKKDVLQYDWNKDLAKLRLMDIYVKLKGSDFFNFVIKRKNELECLVPREKDFRLDLHQSFNNGNATLDFRFTDWKENHDYLTIGIQIEGGQYRLLAERSGKHSGEKIFETFKDIWFDGNFDRSEKECKLFGKKTSLSKLFDSYKEKSGRYMFVYQYYNIENQTYENIFNEIKRDLTKARNIILSKNY